MTWDGTPMERNELAVGSWEIQRKQKLHTEWNWVILLNSVNRLSKDKVSLICKLNAEWKNSFSVLGKQRRPRRGPWSYFYDYPKSRNVQLCTKAGMLYQFEDLSWKRAEPAKAWECATGQLLSTLSCFLRLLQACTKNTPQQMFNTLTTLSKHQQQ